MIDYAHAHTKKLSFDHATYKIIRGAEFLIVIIMYLQKESH